MANIKKVKICVNCGSDKNNVIYYKDPSGKTDGRVCRNCWMRWQANGTFERKRKSRAVGSCRCGKILYRMNKWGLICAQCRKGLPPVVNGVIKKNIDTMPYDERETCRRLVVKWKRGMIQPIDVYSMINIYIEYHFKNEEMDGLDMKKQISKIMTWMEKLFQPNQI